jgi:hypothetical protein
MILAAGGKPSIAIGAYEYVIGMSAMHGDGYASEEADVKWIEEQVERFHNRKR